MLETTAQKRVCGAVIYLAGCTNTNCLGSGGTFSGRASLPCGVCGGV